MALKCRMGTEIEMEAEGAGAEAALRALRTLVERDFAEAHA
jgi:phosphotransferase system HPr-like phosphotransfer protein